MPCFATVTPAPATTKAAVVEMLKVFAAVAAGAAGVDEDLPVHPHAVDARAHHVGGAGDLVHRLALEPERGEERAHLGRRGAAVGDLGHHRHHLGPREVLPLEELRDRLLDHA